MKRNFLILLFSVITFCACSQVTITDDESRWFLEQNEKVKVYEKNIKTKERRIETLDKKIIQLQIIIKSYESDSTSFRTIINTNGDQIKFKDNVIKEANKEIKKLKRQRNMIIGGGGGAVVGSFFGPEGAVVGAVIGGAGGLIFSWIKR